MKIELKEITVAELADGYADKAEEGVVGYGGRLDNSSAVSARVHLQSRIARCGN